MPLALRARAAGLTRGDVHAALGSGELVLSWLNRGTLHLVCRDDYWWLHALTAPTVRAGNRRRLAEEGVTDPPRAVKRIVRALGNGPLLRSEIGNQVDLAGPALTHALVAATLEGLIVRGPVRGREQTFVLAADHLGEHTHVDRGAALAELARRYLASHAPASEADLAYWSGLPLRDVRAGMAAVSRVEAVTSRRPPDIPPKLLPPFDPYILGWKDRSFAIPPELTKRVMPGGGMFRAVVLIDGRVTGTWSRGDGRVALNAPVVDGLEAEIRDVERFLACTRE